MLTKIPEKPESATKQKDKDHSDIIHDIVIGCEKPNPIIRCRRLNSRMERHTIVHENQGDRRRNRVEL